VQPAARLRRLGQRESAVGDRDREDQPLRVRRPRRAAPDRVAGAVRARRGPGEGAAGRQSAQIDDALDLEVRAAPREERVGLHLELEHEVPRRVAVRGDEAALALELPGPPAPVAGPQRDVENLPLRVGVAAPAPREARHLHRELAARVDVVQRRGDARAERVDGAFRDARRRRAQVREARVLGAPPADVLRDDRVRVRLLGRGLLVAEPVVPARGATSARPRPRTPARRWRRDAASPRISKASRMRRNASRIMSSISLLRSARKPPPVVVRFSFVSASIL